MDSLVINGLFLTNDFKKLRIQEKVLSGTSDSAIRSINCCTINDWVKESERNRKQDILIVTEQYEDMKSSLCNLNENVKSEEKIRSLDVDYFKQHVLDVQGMLSDLKNIVKNEFNLLQKNETCLNQEIANLRRFNNKHTMNTKNTKPTVHRKTMKNIINDGTEHKSTQNFMEFVYETGGHYGGWGEEEHNIFIKYWQNCQAQKPIYCQSDDGRMLFKKNLVSKINRELPDLSADDIISHHDWLIEYNRLKDLQAKEISSWKTLRELNKYEKKLSDENLSYNISNEKLDKVKHEYSKQITKKDIEHWKSTKHEENKNRDEIRAETIMIKKASSHDKEKRSKEHVLISNWATSKKCEIDLRQLEKETAVSKEREKLSTEANIKIKQFRLRDNFLMNNRIIYLNKIRAKRTQENRPTIIKKKINQNKAFRCGQYNEPTEQWCRRIAKSEATFNNTSSNPSTSGVENIPKLGVPIWREGIAIR